ncbi:TonB-dependent receptor domain-containing protein [candidate division KSB1 bacterium]
MTAWKSDNALSQSAVKITGFISDASTGMPVAGAAVQVKHTSIGAVSDNNGAYRVEFLPLGEYTLIISHIGYTDAERSGIKVREDYISRQDFSLRQKLFNLQEITVTADRPAAGIHTATLERISISKEELETSNAGSAAEALEHIPGIQIMDSGGSSGEKRISIRGGMPNQVAVLIDGVRLDDGQNDAIDLSTLPLSIIENIEIIKGNLSAFYGPNAVNGVINIATRSPATGGSASAARFTSGSFGEKIYGIDLSRTYASAHFLMSADRGDYTGDFEYTDLRGEKQARLNAFKSYHSLFGKVRKTSRRYDISLQGYVYNAKRGLPGIIYQETPDAISHYRKRILSFSGLISHGAHLSTKIDAAYTGSRTDNRNPAGFAYDTENRNSTRQLDIVQYIESENILSIQTGFSHKNDRLTHTDYLHESFSIGLKRQEVNSLFLSCEAKTGFPLYFDALSLHSAVRYDDHSRIQSWISPNLGIAAGRHRAYDVTFRLNYGRSYRPPNFDDLYYEGFRVEGNPALLPERSRGFDTGITFEFPLFGSMRTEYAYYRTIVKDIILWRKRFDGVFTPFNSARSLLYGSELSLVWSTPGNLLSLSGNHSYSKALNRSGERTTHNKQLPHRPLHTTFLRVTVSKNSLSGGLQHRSVSRRFIREANTKPMPAYRVTDFYSSLKLDLQKYALLARFSIDNLFGEEYMVLERAPIPGRTVRFSLSFQIKP